MNRWNPADRLRVVKLLIGEHRTPGEVSRRFLGSMTFRFMLLAIAISGATFAVRTSDAFQSAQFAAIRAETRQNVANAAGAPAASEKAATDIMAAEPRLLKTVALERKTPEPTKPDPAETSPEHAGLADPALVCKALGGAVWADSALFADHKECTASETDEGYTISQVARGADDSRVDTIRLKLDLAEDAAAEEAASALSDDLTDALQTAEIKAPSRFMESVANLETARAEAGAVRFSLEPEIAHPNRYTLVVRTASSDEDDLLVQARPD